MAIDGNRYWGNKTDLGMSKMPPSRNTKLAGSCCAEVASLE